MNGPYTPGLNYSTQWLQKVLWSLIIVGLAWVGAVPAGADPQVGQPAPNFSLPSTEGKKLKLQDFEGKWLVLYFYPEDFTSGCTIQARRFQEDLPTYQKLKTQVVGVSQDSLDSHTSFCNSEGLKFPLLSDSTGLTQQAYGAPSGARNTYIIDPKGVLRRAFIRVNPLRNSEEVLVALKQLQAAG
ncbi:peroxiredoxin [Anthocerotibacter panamensis]|uniref:peroxiredoxin n=1 Tax=Anthocerotibacter panamensis TaxID=2857077 RepID=UPI001C4079AD|nr:peroxiredoxin [Anthocerotibacter panamensis]